MKSEKEKQKRKSFNLPFRRILALTLAVLLVFSITDISGLNFLVKAGEGSGEQIIIPYKEGFTECTYYIIKSDNTVVTGNGSGKLINAAQNAQESTATYLEVGMLDVGSDKVYIKYNDKTYMYTKAEGTYTGSYTDAEESSEPLTGLYRYNPNESVEYKVFTSKKPDGTYRLTNEGSFENLVEAISGSTIYTLCTLKADVEKGTEPIYVATTEITVDDSIELTGITEPELYKITGNSVEVLSGSVSGTTIIIDNSAAYFNSSALFLKLGDNYYQVDSTETGYSTSTKCYLYAAEDTLEIYNGTKIVSVKNGSVLAHGCDDSKVYVFTTSEDTNVSIVAAQGMTVADEIKDAIGDEGAPVTYVVIDENGHNKHYDGQVSTSGDSKIILLPSENNTSTVLVKYTIDSVDVYQKFDVSGTLGTESERLYLKEIDYTSFKTIVEAENGCFSYGTDVADPVEKYVNTSNNMIYAYFADKDVSPVITPYIELTDYTYSEGTGYYILEGDSVSKSNLTYNSANSTCRIIVPDGTADDAKLYVPVINDNGTIKYMELTVSDYNGYSKPVSHDNLKVITTLTPIEGAVTEPQETGTDSEGLHYYIDDAVVQVEQYWKYTITDSANITCYVIKSNPTRSAAKPQLEEVTTGTAEGTTYKITAKDGIDYVIIGEETAGVTEWKMYPADEPSNETSVEMKEVTLDNDINDIVSDYSVENQGQCIYGENTSDSTKIVRFFIPTDAIDKNQTLKIVPNSGTNRAECEFGIFGVVDSAAELSDTIDADSLPYKTFTIKKYDTESTINVECKKTGGDTEAAKLEFNTEYTVTFSTNKANYAFNVVDTLFENNDNLSIAVSGIEVVADSDYKKLQFKIKVTENNTSELNQDTVEIVPLYSYCFAEVKASIDNVEEVNNTYKLLPGVEYTMKVSPEVAVDEWKVDNSGLTGQGASSDDYSAYYTLSSDKIEITPNIPAAGITVSACNVSDDVIASFTIKLASVETASEDNAADLKNNWQYFVQGDTQLSNLADISLVDTDGKRYFNRKISVYQNTAAYKVWFRLSNDSSWTLVKDNDYPNVTPVIATVTDGTKLAEQYVVEDAEGNKYLSYEYTFNVDTAAPIITGTPVYEYKSQHTEYSSAAREQGAFSTSGRYSFELSDAVASDECSSGIANVYYINKADVPDDIPDKLSESNKSYFTENTDFKLVEPEQGKYILTTPVDANGDVNYCIYAVDKAGNILKRDNQNMVKFTNLDTTAPKISNLQTSNAFESEGSEVTTVVFEVKEKNLDKINIYDGDSTSDDNLLSTYTYGQAVTDWVITPVEGEEDTYRIKWSKSGVHISNRVIVEVVDKAGTEYNCIAPKLAGLTADTSYITISNKHYFKGDVIYKLEISSEADLSDYSVEVIGKDSSTGTDKTLVYSRSQGNISYSADVNDSTRKYLTFTVSEDISDAYFKISITNGASLTREYYFEDCKVVHDSTSVSVSNITIKDSDGVIHKFTEEGNSKEQWYFNGAVTVTADISDNNLDEASIAFMINGVSVNDRIDISYTGNTYTFIIPESYGDFAKVSFGISAKDKSGNEVDKASAEYVLNNYQMYLDTNKPSIETNVAVTGYTGRYNVAYGTEEDTYEYFTNNSLTFKVNVSDEGTNASGIDGTDKYYNAVGKMFYIVKHDTDKETSTNIPVTYKDGSLTATVSAEEYGAGRAYLELVVYDKAGNRSENVVITPYFVVDTEAPDTDIVYNTASNAEIYESIDGIGLSAADSLSALNNLKWSVVSDNVSFKVIALDEAASAVGSGKRADYTEYFTDGENNTARAEWSIVRNILPDEDSEGTVTISIQAEDNAKNSSEPVEKTYKIDNQAPRIDSIKLTHSSNTGSESGYYKDAAYVVTVYDMYLDTDACVAEITVNNQIKKLNPDKVEKITDEKGKGYIFTYEIKKDGDYSDFTFTARDKSYNSNSDELYISRHETIAVEKSRYAVDNVPAVLKVSYDVDETAGKLNKDGTRYFNSERIADIMVTERYFADNADSFEVVLGDGTKLNGALISTEEYNSLFGEDKPQTYRDALKLGKVYFIASTGNVYTAKIYFEDGDVVDYSISYTDPAHNEPVAYNDAFMVDTTAPFVSRFEIVGNKSDYSLDADVDYYNGDSITVNFNLSDSNLDMDTFVLTIGDKEYRSGDEAISIDNGNCSIVLNVTELDEYVSETSLKVTVQDKAGNPLVRYADAVVGTRKGDSASIVESDKRAFSVDDGVFTYGSRFVIDNNKAVVSDITLFDANDLTRIKATYDDGIYYFSDAAVVTFKLSDKHPATGKNTLTEYNTLRIYKLNDDGSVGEEVKPEGLSALEVTYKDTTDYLLGTFTVPVSILSQLDENQVYLFELYIMDKAGNSDIYLEPSGKFIYDATAPVVSITHDFSNVLQNITGYYSAVGRTDGKRINVYTKVTITVIENNFDARLFNYGVTLNNAGQNGTYENIPYITVNGQNVNGDLAAYLRDQAHWEKSYTDGTGNIYTTQLEINGDGHFKFYIPDNTQLIMDRAGNMVNQEKSSYASAIEYVLDGSPVRIINSKVDGVIMNVDANGHNRVNLPTVDNIYGNADISGQYYFDNSAVTCSFRLDETTSGILSVQYSLGDGVYRDVPYDEGKNIYSFSIASRFFGTATVKIMDKAGNITVQSMATLVQDSQKPAADISFVTQPNENGFYNEDAVLKLAVTDGTDSSGIYNIKYEIGSMNPVDIVFNEYKTEWDETITVPARTNNNNNVLAKLIVEDSATNINEVEEQIKIDCSEPVINVTYDINEPMNEDFYKDVRTALITIDELNFDSARVELLVTRDGVNVPVNPAFATDGIERTAVDGSTYYTYSMSLPFDEDGDYTFTVRAVDLADNEAVYDIVDEFTVDRTLPVIAVDYDINESQNDFYFGESRVATITINEHNFDPANFKLQIVAQNNGESITAPAMSAFTSAGDVHTATITFDTDEEVTFSAAYTDMAGNDAEMLEEQHFVVDLTSPVISITNVESGRSYGNNTAVSPIIQVTDTNYDAESVTVRLVGNKIGQIGEYTYSVADIENGQSISIADIEYDQSLDDIYTLYVDAVDLAGHSSMETINFSVNRYGSIFTIDDTSTDIFANYYTGTLTNGLIVHEQNVDEIDMDKLHISYSMNGNLVELSAGTDFEIIHEKDSYGWNNYSYIFGDNIFVDEGVYIITISSEDAAGNIADNKVKNVNLEFCIDNTLPSIVVSGVENGEIYTSEYISAIISAYDNIGLSRITVTLNGKDTVYTEEDMEDGKLIVDIQSSSSRQTLSVTCQDYAGNTIVFDEITFTVSTSQFVAFREKVLKNPVVWGGTAGVAVAGTGSVIFIRRRKLKIK